MMLTATDFRRDLRELGRWNQATEVQPLWWLRAIQARMKLCRGLARLRVTVPLHRYMRMNDLLHRVMRRRFATRLPILAVQEGGAD